MISPGRELNLTAAPNLNYNMVVFKNLNLKNTTGCGSGVGSSSRYLRLTGMNLGVLGQETDLLMEPGGQAVN